ncbi:cleavage stimulation factor subunit 2 [Marchantia polymorpha subsp. ruderalis]|uniref:RRM domain-containing protein n=2 Tax=Marchantia polymorpha TaxID=3197 RepID=A0AAF6B9V2_MARPO|nr:hypothetical protein MARPO_0070s0034 [Marchantia polymorpha]BBN08786.1 hypothetical protein Mp_4g14470 [Marchantia polymorpha subsp. ruderalis]|eukprot:PTQ35565.1 hypothetical protein MARPO_0070s0034 [Marchantia polymorpha]
MSGQQHRASRCVFVGNIPYDATEEQLVQICEEVGPVVSFRLVVDRDTGKPKGYGFCEFRDEETALSARRNLQGYEINGRQLRVDFAENEKGGGGVDRSRDQQGRGGPGFQQAASNVDVLKHGSVGAPQPFVSAGAPGTSEQPIGRAAASQAALMMAGALGGAQQLPNMMVPAQGPLQTMSAPPALVPGNGGTVAGTDALTNHLAGMSKHQLYEIMSQMKIMIQQNQQQARQILVANPQLTKALFQAQIMLGMVRPQQVVATQQPQTQPAPPQQPASLMQQQQPRPPQPHIPPPAQIQPQAPNKSTFQPPLPQQPQLQQTQTQVQQPQAQPQSHLPQGFQQQGGMVQTSMGMTFQPGQPPPPSQPPPQQLYQMGSNMMGTTMQRMSSSSGGVPVGQGNGGIAGGTGTMGPSGTGQMNRGPGLGAMDNRNVQLNQVPPTSVTSSGVSGVLAQAPMPVAQAGPMASGHPMPSGNSGGVVGMGGSLPSNLAPPQMMGDPNARGYSGMGAMNTGMNAGLNTAVNSGMTPSMNSSMNPGMNTTMNTTMNTNLNSGMNPPMNTGMSQSLSTGVNQGMNALINPGMNANMNSGLSALNPGMGSSLNQGMNSGLNLSQSGGFVGTTDGTAVTSTAMQPQSYSQVQLQAPPAPQQPQIQVPLELEQQKALLQQVMNLTTEQIMSLPPEQRQQVLQLQQALR